MKYKVRPETIVTEGELREAIEMLHGPAISVSREITHDGKKWGKSETVWLKIGKPFLGMLDRVRNAELSVFVCVALHIGKDMAAWPSIATVAYYTGYDERTVRRAIRSLEGMGLIVTDKRNGDTSRYTVAGYFAYGKSGTPDIHVPPTPDMGVRPPRTYTSPPPRTYTSPKEEPLRSRTIEEETTGGQKVPARPRDLLFDAICEVCRVDPATAGPSVGKVRAALVKASPPYTSEEIAAFGRVWWADKWQKKPPTLWQLRERIGIVRNGNGRGGPAPAPKHPPINLADYPTYAEWEAKEAKEAKNA